MDSLTIQDIAPYLPYDLKVQMADYGNKTGKVTALCTDDTICVMLIGFIPLRRVKPYLLPISCLTTHIAHKSKDFFPLVELAKIAYPQYKWHLSPLNLKPTAKGHDIQFRYNGNDFEIGYYHQFGHEDWEISKNQYQLFQKLAEWHIDFMGLIDRGLAVDKTTLKL